MQEEVGYLLHETSPAYNGDFDAENSPLSVDNIDFWDTNYKSSEA